MGLMYYTISLSVLNTLILAGLLFFQVKNYSRFRSSFAAALLLFIAVFFVENLIASYFFITMMSLYANGTEIVVFFMTFLEFIAFSVYSWLVFR